MVAGEDRLFAGNQQPSTRNLLPLYAAVFV
jgi:hypothetical protein